MLEAGDVEVVVVVGVVELVFVVVVSLVVVVDVMSCWKTCIVDVREEFGG